ncbi:ArnT family glycosyltransferase [Tundrisphaera lichenicola]|uniref:ArnT family glycosyltransferase n=1 Tax=Tundrisphaera lichenicola TaxID=2029860 RepID=UPI003EBDDBA0
MSMSLAGMKRSPAVHTKGIRSTALGIAGIATLLVILTIGDPGITVDEPLDVRPGRTYISALRSRGIHFFDREVVDQVFRDNSEHPPLGRWLLGIASTMGEPFEILAKGGPDPVGIYVVAGRLAPALIFGLMVGLVSLESGRRYGRVAGLSAGFALLIMPRMFAHAHIAALDTFIAFFWVLALLAALKAVEGNQPTFGMLFAGLAWGLALLTKIHAWFLPPIVLAWCLLHLRPRRALLVWSLWLISGLTIFFAGWPWLWADPVGRLGAYLVTGIERVSIRVLYFGTVYQDRDVPWHYPWFYLLTTIPVGLLAIGILGAVRGPAERKLERYALFLVGSIAFFPLIFSTNVPVYDCERLFLVSFPILAILVGRGFAFLWEHATSWSRYVLVFLLLGQSYGILAFHPFGLSYYNLLVGGLPGAERLGLELTYWGDTVDGPLLNRLAELAQEGQSVALAPTLAPDQGKVVTTRRLARIPIVIQDQDYTDRSDWLLVSRRSAYWTDEVRSRLESDPLVMTRSKQGVWLSKLIGPRILKKP